MKTRSTGFLSGKKKQEIMMYATAAVMAAVLVAMVYHIMPTVMAAGTVEEIFGIVGTVLRTISCVAGGILILGGIFKYATAHATDNGPDQQKGIIMIATGIVLILLFTVVVTDAVIKTLATLIESKINPTGKQG